MPYFELLTAPNSEQLQREIDDLLRHSLEDEEQARFAADHGFIFEDLGEQYWHGIPCRATLAIDVAQRRLMSVMMIYPDIFLETVIDRVESGLGEPSLVFEYGTEAYIWKAEGIQVKAAVYDEDEGVGDIFIDYQPPTSAKDKSIADGEEPPAGPGVWMIETPDIGLPVVYNGGTADDPRHA